MTPDEEAAARRFSDNLYRQRSIRRISQEVLGLDARVHRTQISQLENGKRVPLVLTVVKLASVLGLSPNELLDGIRWDPGQGPNGAFVVEDTEPKLLLSAPGATRTARGGRP
jgi:transcriptional regulator with XRE-family HTH domain